MADLIEFGVTGLVITDLDTTIAPLQRVDERINVGVLRGRVPPGFNAEPFDVLLCSDAAAAAPWVGLPPSRLSLAIETLKTQFELHPIAATVAAQLLRMSMMLDFQQALLVESISYSMLLGSPGFTAWRVANPARDRPEDSDARVLVEATDSTLVITLNRPRARNAFDARMRDELVSALDFALSHPDHPAVSLYGSGVAFSAGGDLNEFGTANDPGLAHLVRSLQSPARLANALGERLCVRLHGACIGAGIEIAAAAHRVEARPGAVFRLPEVSMGLIPGAGGTASISRRVGRHRTCYMVLTGAEIDLHTALAWTLVDSLDLRP